MEDFEAWYVPRLVQFLQAMTKVEAKRKVGVEKDSSCLSTRMRDSGHREDSGTITESGKAETLMWYTKANFINQEMSSSSMRA